MPFDLEAFKEALQVQVDFQTPQQEEVSITVENLLSKLNDEVPEDEESQNGPKHFMEELLEAVRALSQLEEDTDLDSVPEQTQILNQLLSEESADENYFQKHVCVYFEEDSTEYTALLQFQTTVLDLFDEEAQLTRRSAISTASLVPRNIHADSDVEETSPAAPLRLNLARAVFPNTPRTNVSGDSSPRDDQDLSSTDRSNRSLEGGTPGLRLSVTEAETPRFDEPPKPKPRQPIGTFTPGFVGRLAKVAGKTTPSRTIANQGDFEALIRQETDKVNTMRALNDDINQPGADIDTIAKQHLADKDSVKQKSNPLKYEDDVRIKHKINTAKLHEGLSALVVQHGQEPILEIKNDHSELLIKASFNKKTNGAVIDVFSEEDRHLEKAVELALKACGDGQQVVIDDPSNTERAMKVYLLAKAAGGGDKFKLGAATKQAIADDTAPKLAELKNLYHSVSKPGSTMTAEKIREALDEGAKDERHGFRPW